MYIIIAALDQNHAIGHKGQLLFHLKDDMRFFKETTSGHPVIMGRKTWKSLPGKLPNRTNLVVSHAPVDGADQTITDLPEFISKHLSDPEDYYIIGGANLYQTFLPEAEILLLTEIEAVAPVADTYFPSFDPNNYTREVLEEGAENGVKFSIVKYTRKPPLDKGAPMV